MRHGFTHTHTHTHTQAPYTNNDSGTAPINTVLDTTVSRKMISFS
jgi:hypothetical protein